MTRPVVLILGGQGVFGRRIAANLTRHPEIEIVIGGRHGPLKVDVSLPGAIAAVQSVRPAVVVDTVGPFQNRTPALAQRCALHGIHYVDIADARERVAGIVALDVLARSHDVAIISGASTVPALSTAIVDELAPRRDEIVEIEVGITPGHRAPRGVATVSAILSYCGRPVPPVCGSEVEYGWGGLVKHVYPPPVGARWLSNVDTPERALWRGRYPRLERAAIRAGFEIGLLHLCLSALSRGVRAHVLPSLAPCARVFLWVADRFDRFGTDSGAMHVRVATRDSQGRMASHLATIVAEGGDGPEIPAAPAALVVKKLLGLPGYAPLTQRGAMPCIGLVTRTEITDELRAFAIRYSSDGR